MRGDRGTPHPDVREQGERVGREVGEAWCERVGRMRRWGGCYSGVVESGGGDGSAMLRDLNMREERAGTGVGGCGCYRTGSVGDSRGVARPTGISAAVAPALDSGTTQHTQTHTTGGRQSH